jgi:ribose-phosphate pyrophosphokinase
MMYALYLSNLRTSFDKGSKEIEWEGSEFPSKCELHFRLKYKPPEREVLIVTRIQSHVDIMRLFLATDALRAHGVSSISLYIPYIPYGRQDRSCQPGEAFSLRMFAKLLNAQKYETVYTVDPHSDVTQAVIENCVPLVFDEHMRKAVKEWNPGFLCIPDAGASKRNYPILRDADRLGLSVAQAIKRRVEGNVEIGGIYYKGSLEDGRVLIVDDICDGGGTFVALAQELKERGASQVCLAVTHGLFTQGADALLNGGIDKIYTTNSFMHPASRDDERIVRVSL